MPHLRSSLLEPAYAPVDVSQDPENGLLIPIHLPFKRREPRIKGRELRIHCAETNIRFRSLRTHLSTENIAHIIDALIEMTNSMVIHHHGEKNP